jgi:phage/plasmid-like protein (TIGR03299 family)
MAHEIENMMYVGKKPWHSLGTAFVEPPTLDEAIVAAGLNWTVTTEPVYSAAGEQLPAQLTRRSSDSSILGVVGPNYVPLQNVEAFDFFRPFIDGAGGVTIETAGSLRQGKRVFILCKINNDPMVIKGNDTVEQYLLLSNSHDGTLAVRAGFTPIRVVCNNTLSMAMNNNASKLIRVRHTKNIVANLDLVRQTMDLANKQFIATAEQYRLLANREINTEDLKKYVSQVFNSKVIDSSEGSSGRVYNQIVPLFEKGRGNDMKEIRGTLWAAYNAITEYIQYERGNNSEIRLDQAWFGQGSVLNKKALDVGLTML